MRNNKVAMKKCMIIGLAACAVVVAGAILPLCAEEVAAVFGGAEEAGMKGCAGVFATHLHVRQNMV